MRKLILISIAPLLFCVNLLAQDVLIYYDGEAVLTEVLRIDDEFVYHRGISSNEQTPLGIVDVLLSENHPLRRPWSFSLGIGITGLGTAGAWNKILSQNNFDGAVSSWFGGSLRYPKNSAYLDLDLGLDYRYHAMRSWGWKLQWFNSGTIEGYDKSTHSFGYLEIPYNQRSILVQHRWFFDQNGGTNAYIGPSLHQISYSYQGRPNDPSPTYKSAKLGVTGGLQVTLVERHNAFVRLGFEFALVPSLTTEIHHMTGTVLHESGPNRVYLPALVSDDLRLSAFSVRIVSGLKK